MRETLSNGTKIDKRKFKVTWSNPRLKDPWIVNREVVGVRNKNNLIARLKRRSYNYTVQEIPT